MINLRLNVAMRLPVWGRLPLGRSLDYH